VLKTEYPRPVPPDPIHSRGIELRISKVVLEERGTLLGTPSWFALVRGVVVSSETLPFSELTNAFTVIGQSGTAYRGIVSAVGPGRLTWQRPADTGQIHLPANVAGELEILAQVGEKDTPDEIAALTFLDVQVPIAR